VFFRSQFCTLEAGAGLVDIFLKSLTVFDGGGESAVKKFAPLFQVLEV
jgi:hypothetical protein